MNSKGKIIGLILIGAGIVLCLAVGIWLAFSEGLSRGGAILGGILVLLFMAPLIGVGIYLWVRGGQEEKSMAEVAKQRKLLSIVKTQGQVTIGDIALELDGSYDQVKEWIHELVGRGLFSGYINWDEGILYSQQASQLQGETQCKHCGGEVNLVGKGVVSCPYCGTEYFLS